MPGETPVEDLLRIPRRKLFQTYGLEEGMKKREAALRQRLTPEVVRGLLTEWLDRAEIRKRDDTIRWDRLASALPIEHHTVMGYEVRTLALAYFVSFWADQIPAMYTWWWRLRLIRGLPDPTLWLVERDQERRQSKITAQLFEVIFGHPLQRNPQDYIRIAKVFELARAAFALRALEEGR